MATGARLTVVVNHLKSKGSGCGAGDDDTTTGQGNCNGTRTRPPKPSPTGSPPIRPDPATRTSLIIGDLNSYAKEDPIVALQDAGYTDLVAEFGGPSAYGFVFDGQLGYLDHGMSNASLTPQVTGAAEWHINADEIPLFDYNDDVRSAGEATFEEESDVFPLYEANQFRSSDHDPVIVGLDLPAGAAAPAQQPHAAHGQHPDAAPAADGRGRPDGNDPLQLRPRSRLAPGTPDPEGRVGDDHRPDEVPELADPDVRPIRRHRG